ncbi:hypothetical protein DFH11DRAFT_427656 [Phellopilus nigrolimitatus]|nr:hypothetical protein DFH11DRAFT_200923 [Phellopilus nigrolimitatus]KAH8119178.1 hypothetical protein DFH11DRAFT_427656 [Phellopilus nigrolimitatus]
MNTRITIAVALHCLFRLGQPCTSRRSTTIGLRDTGLLVQKTKTIVDGGSEFTVQYFHTLSGLEFDSDTSAFDERYPVDPSAAIKRLKLSESSESIKRNTCNDCATRRRAISTAS